MHVVEVVHNGAFFVDSRPEKVDLLRVGLHEVLLVAIARRHQEDFDTFLRDQKRIVIGVIDSCGRD